MEWSFLGWWAERNSDEDGDLVVSFLWGWRKIGVVGVCKISHGRGFAFEGC